MVPLPVLACPGIRAAITFPSPAATRPLSTMADPAVLTTSGVQKMTDVSRLGRWLLVDRQMSPASPYCMRFCRYVLPDTVRACTDRAALPP